LGIPKSCLHIREHRVSWSRTAKSDERAWGKEVTVFRIFFVIGTQGAPNIRLDIMLERTKGHNLLLERQALFFEIGQLVRGRGRGK
jgi:hypothetical protein